MDSRLKQRLIGAFVIVLLAVIFVPYLVQEPAEPTNPVASTAIPPAPESLPSGQPDLTISLPDSAQPATSTTSTEQPASVEDTQLSLQPSITEVDISELSPPQESAETLPEQPVESSSPTEIAQPATPLASTEPSTPSPETAATAEAAAPTQRPEAPAQPRTANLPQVDLVGRTNNPAEQTSSTPAPPRTEQASPRSTPPPARTTQAPARQAPSQPSQPPAPPPEVARSAPAQGIALPKVELIGRSMNATASRTTSRPQTVSTASQTQRSAGGRWVVQVGSFSLQQNANNMSTRLRNRNFSSSVEPVQVSGQTMYRVRVGPYSSRNESEQALTRLRQAGISSGQVISLNN